MEGGREEPSHLVRDPPGGTLSSRATVVGARARATRGDNARSRRELCRGAARALCERGEGRRAAAGLEEEPMCVGGTVLTVQRRVAPNLDRDGARGGGWCVCGCVGGGAGV